MTRLLLVLFALLGGMAQAAPPAPPSEIPYRVRPGDTLIDLAQRGLRQQADYLVVQRRNRVANPRRLQPGSTLRIPVRLLRTEPVAARIAAFRGTVRVNGGAARVGMAIGEGMELQTGTNGFLAIEIDDGSQLNLPSRSRVRVAALHRIVLTGRAVKRFELGGGRTEADVQPARDAGDSFEIRTPVSVAAVRGTRFRVSYVEEGEVSGTSVIEGRVAVAAAEEEVAVPVGQGVIASAEGTGDPIPLLPRPSLRDPDRLQYEALVTFAVEPLPGAARYRVQLATDAGFVDTFAEAESESGEVNFADVPNGSFFARVTALSPEGLEGFPAVHAFERRQNSITAEAGEAEDCPVARCLRFRWRTGGEGERRFRFQIAREPEGVPIVDEAELTGNEFVVTDLPAGTYHWRVESSLVEDGRRQSRWTDYQELRVAPAR